MKKENSLFEIEFKMNVLEYKKMVRYVPSFYWKNVIYRSFLLVLLVMIFSVIKEANIYYAVIVSLILVLFMMIFCKVKIDFLAENNYKFYEKRGMIGKDFKINFYDDYLVNSCNNVDVKIEYKNIDKIIEDDSNFYIFSKRNICIINKNNCDKKKINFIRNINSNVLVNRMSDSKKGILKEKTFSKILLVLEILSLLSFCGAILSINIISNKVVDFLLTEKMFVFWLWLPIPIFSIIFGYYCKRSSINPKLSIRFGVLVSLLLIIFGSFSIVMPVGRVSYDVVKEYEEVLKIDIPKDGDFVQNKYNTYFDLDKKNVVVTEMYFKNDKKLEKYIISNDNWIDLDTAVKEYERIVPYQMKNRECNKCYITIYNNDLDKYNSFSDLDKNTHFTVGLYNTESNVLEINSFEMGD